MQANNTMTETITSVVIAKWIAMVMWAGIGGLVHALVELRKGNIKDKLDLFILSVISGFAGTMWGLLALNFYPNNIVLIAFASGMGGFLSLEGLALIVNWLKKKILTQ